ncbi:septal ring lytic transglycosylase RlpA family protein [Bosea sp. WAO]|uniref:septal ring lytic transglycosylase RlpA family protein n=1 Tax=Bosea sp. WAO TaxID=406341 RepID=UPI0009FA554B|nr:septal ring lytic transglycosylase RlpA family protein [Bosea sp. WAO]
MIGRASSSAPVVSSANEARYDSRSCSHLKTVARLGCVMVAGVFLANCANDGVARRGKSKEIGAFPSSKYGPASARVVADGEPVPKGGGRQLIGRSYTVAGKRYTPYDKPLGHTLVGTASWYGEAFHGRRTANGEVYDRYAISAAHPTMPLPAYARVTNVTNSRSIIVRVNDRGPFHGGRLMDVSQRTADALAFRHLGTARVKVEYLGQASLGGSDDKMLLASLRTDGQPASIPGQSSRSLVAGNTQVDLGSEVEEQRPQPAPVPVRATPVSQPVVQAYAEQPQRASLQSPIQVTTVSAPGDGVPMRGVRLPPERPFDLDTIANAGKPVPVLRPAVMTSASTTPRTSVASLFAAPERAPTARFAAGHPLAAGVKPQILQPLARN